MIKVKNSILDKALSEDKSHPNYKHARFPAHEIETVIEDTVRKRLSDFIIERDGTNFDYLIKHQKTIPTYDLIRALVTKTIIHTDTLVLHIKPVGLKKLMEEHLNIVLKCHTGETKLQVPYHSERGQDGAVIIKSEGKTDIFNLPPRDLKKLIQGIIWRDEHFEGIAIKAIARREKCSHDYVSSAIFKSFKILQNAT